MLPALRSPGITPHSLRHTFTSLLFAIGEDPVSVMRQLGHIDPAFTLRAYMPTR
jgi:integrase